MTNEYAPTPEIAAICKRCGQTDLGQTGEHACSECGLPWVWGSTPHLAAMRPSDQAETVQEMAQAGLGVPGQRVASAPSLLSECEQRAVLADLMGLECLINYHDCQDAGADAVEPGAGSGNARRALELLKLGREIIAADPDLWHEEQKAPFALRYSERANKEQP